MSRVIRLVPILLLFLAGVGSPVQASVFDDARVAAGEGRYREVVELLTGALDTGSLTGAERVVALSNRGIAYSLLKAHALARKDLYRAISIDPDHKLTLNHLGILAEHVDGDYAEAFQWYQKGATAGFAASQVNLASLYIRGLGVGKDPSMALQWYRAAADQGYAMAYAPLGRMYLAGEGVSRDYGAAIQWLQKGVGQGVVEAYYYLGLAHEKGLGMRPDPEKAAGYYLEAAMQGHGEAQNALGYLYRRGAGVEQDFREAAKWYQLAADQGVVQAMNRLAWLLATCPVRSVCNGRKALSLALDAVRAERTPGNLDSLAAAYARVGEFDQAIATVESIVSMKGGSRYANRLTQYRQGIPWQL